MKKQMIFILSTILVGSSSFLLFEQDERPPEVIENWDGDGMYKEFFCQSEGVKDDVYQDQMVRGESALEGNTSLRLSWELRGGQYFCWGVDLRQGSTKGKDFHEAKFLSFKVQLENGVEKFEIKIKDTKGINPGVSSNRLIEKNNKPQTIRIPLARFGTAVDLFSLENISLDFDKTTAGKEGAIIVDDFKFEFE